MMTMSEYEKTFVAKFTTRASPKARSRQGRGCPEAPRRQARLAPSREQRQQVTSCTDTAQLDLWFDRAITAGTAAELFTD
jgi:hypothetical protein